MSPINSVPAATPSTTLARAVDFAELGSGHLRQDLLGNDKCHQLHGIRRLHDIGRRSECHGIEGEMRNERTASRVGHIGFGRIRVVIVRNAPVR